MKTRKIDLGMVITEDLLMEMDPAIAGGMVGGGIAGGVTQGLWGAGLGGAAGAGIGYIKNRQALQALKQKQMACGDPQCKATVQAEINALKNKIWASAKKGAVVGGVGLGTLGAAGGALQGGAAVANSGY